MKPCKTCTAGCLEALPGELQPYGTEIYTSDGVFIKEIRIPRVHSYIPQHSHDYDHTSLLAVGSIRVWKDGVLDRDYKAPAGIFIEAGVKHTFLTLADDTIVYCIHNVSRNGQVSIAEEHQIVGG